MVMEERVVEVRCKRCGNKLGNAMTVPVAMGVSAVCGPCIETQKITGQPLEEKTRDPIVELLEKLRYDFLHYELAKDVLPRIPSVEVLGLLASAVRERLRAIQGLQAFREELEMLTRKHIAPQDVHPPQ